jgi:hypothetical protein
MANPNHKQVAAGARLDRNLEAIVTFLDPYLAARSRAKHFEKQGQWPVRKSLAFLLFASLFLWSLLIGAAWFLAALL